jgi:hypothetical protein
MSAVIAVVDRGIYWSVQYTDGEDTVPKDPRILDTGAAQADANGNPTLAQKLRAYAASIRLKGVPAEVGPGVGLVVGGVFAAIVAALLVARSLGR